MQADEKCVKSHVGDLELNPKLLGNQFAKLNVKADDGILAVDIHVVFKGRVIGRGSKAKLSALLNLVHGGELGLLLVLGIVVFVGGAFLHCAGGKRNQHDKTEQKCKQFFHGVFDSFLIVL